MKLNTIAATVSAVLGYALAGVPAPDYNASSLHLAIATAHSPSLSPHITNNPRPEVVLTAGGPVDDTSLTIANVVARSKGNFYGASATGPSGQSYSTATSFNGDYNGARTATAESSSAFPTDTSNVSATTAEVPPYDTVLPDKEANGAPMIDFTNSFMLLVAAVASSLLFL